VPIVLHIAAPESVRLIDVSPPSWIVEMVLVHKGLPYERNALAFDRGEHRRPEVLALNPRGTIPILVDDGCPVSETFAILEYLELTRPTPPLLPADRPATLARALTRLHETGELKTAGMALFAYLMRTPEEHVEPATLTRLRDAFVAELHRMEAALDEAPYLAGPEPTLADLVAHAYVATAVYLGLDPSPVPRVAAHHDRMWRLPAVVRTRSPAWREGGRARL
jgi:glutathione S-transferase